MEQGPIKEDKKKDLFDILLNINTQEEYNSVDWESKITKEEELQRKKTEKKLKQNIQLTRYKLLNNLKNSNTDVRFVLHHKVLNKEYNFWWCTQQEEAIKILIARDQNPAEKDADGNSAYDIAKKENFTHLYDLMEREQNMYKKDPSKYKKQYLG